MNHDLALLRETLETALAADDRFPARFYELLFQREPSLEALFVSHSRGTQIRSFGKKLVAIVDQLDDAELTARELEALATTHLGYGVTDAMYAPVGEALFDTLREACGASFTAEAERAWRAAYARIALRMMATR